MTARKVKPPPMPIEPDGLCNDPVCGLTAVIDGWCILHAPDPEGAPPANHNPAEDEPEISFNGSSALALAAVLIMTTADILDNEGETTDEILGGLAAVTGMPLDVAAGLLLTTTLLAQAGELTSKVLKAAAETYTKQAQEES